MRAAILAPVRHEILKLVKEGWPPRAAAQSVGIDPDRMDALLMVLRESLSQLQEERPEDWRIAARPVQMWYIELSEATASTEASLVGQLLAKARGGDTKAILWWLARYGTSSPADTTARQLAELKVATAHAEYQLRLHAGSGRARLVNSTSLLMEARGALDEKG